MIELKLSKDAPPQGPPVCVVCKQPNEAGRWVYCILDIQWLCEPCRERPFEEWFYGETA